MKEASKTWNSCKSHKHKVSTRVRAGWSAIHPLWVACTCKVHSCGAKTSKSSTKNVRKKLSCLFFHNTSSPHSLNCYTEFYTIRLFYFSLRCSIFFLPSLYPVIWRSKAQQLTNWIKMIEKKSHWWKNVVSSVRKKRKWKWGRKLYFL